MRKLIITSLSLMLGLSLGAANATAGTITFDLDCTFSGAGSCDAGTLFGTLSLSDTGTDGEFDIVVDLVGDAINKVLAIYLNFAPGVGGFTFDTANEDGVIASQDGLQADGFTLGLFDLKIPDPPPGELDFEPYMNTIIVSGDGFEGLTVEAFNDVISGNHLLYAAVHIGNLGDTPGSPGENSLWVGADSGPDITTTPEPGLLVLLGTGLLGAAVATRRRKETR